ncbi:Thy-1 membrane glycoprotein [Varanus komodoensis]|nr:Thy-1 membrane glycoprotein [Varanus komodoensis]
MHTRRRKIWGGDRQEKGEEVAGCLQDESSAAELILRLVVSFAVEGNGTSRAVKSKELAGELDWDLEEPDFFHGCAVCRGRDAGGKMKSTIGIAILVTVLQVARCQRVRDLTACLSGKSLRLDCHYDRKTDNPLSYEFRLTKDHGEGSVVAGNLKVPSSVYKGRASVNTTNNLVCLYLHGFTTADEGVYVCKLKITNDYEGPDSRNISVIKDRLEKCAGISLLIQNTSWLLLLLLSLPLLQAVDFVSL